MPLAIKTSDPIAMAGGTRAMRTSAGVKRAPPPVDVAPTSIPTKKPIIVGVSSTGKKNRGRLLPPRLLVFPMFGFCLSYKAVDNLIRPSAPGPLRGSIQTQLQVQL